MPPLHAPLHRILAAACCMLCAGACAQDPPESRDVAEGQAAGCLPGGDGHLEAHLRGALVADLAWQNAEMQCDGGPHPDGSGLRITIAGPLPGTSSRLRFIFGIDPRDAASGVAEAYPTNLTAIVEGGQQMYATRGDDKCAALQLERVPLPGSQGRLDRVRVRGYCIDPASDMAGTTRLLVPTFSFTALIRTGDDP